MKRALRHLRANTVAYLALFVALGGTSYAAFRLPAGSVGNRQLANHSVSAIKLDRGSIAGYVYAWATVDPTGHVVYSRPKASVVYWHTNSPAPPGGLIRFDRPYLDKCFALATASEGTPAYVSATAEALGSGKHQQTGVVLQISSLSAGAHIAVVCPQP